MRSDFECRTEEEVADFYTRAVRGADDVPLESPSPPALAAFDGDVRALLLLRGHDLALAPLTAAHGGRRECLEVLHEWGCDLGHADNVGCTPTYMAAWKCHEGCLHVLKEAGCDLGQSDHGGYTPAY